MINPNRTTSQTTTSPPNCRRNSTAVAAHFSGFRRTSYSMACGARLWQPQGAKSWHGWTWSLTTIDQSFTHSPLTIMINHPVGNSYHWVLQLPFFKSWLNTIGASIILEVNPVGLSTYPFLVSVWSPNYTAETWLKPLVAERVYPLCS